MKKIFLFAAAFAATALISCTKTAADSNTPSGETDTKTAITFTPSVKGTTRVVDDLFEIDDVISVIAIDGEEIFADRVPYSYNGNVFASEDPIFFTNSFQSLEFWAAYPAIEDFGYNYDFTVETEQNSGDNYEMSDLLLSMTENTTDNCPTLSFYHVMSSIIMNIDTPNMSDGVLTLYAATSTSVDMMEGVEYESASNISKITAADNGTDSYKAILVPQVIEAGTLMATYAINGELYEWYLEEDLTFKLGYRYTYDWDLIENLVSFDTYINGWEDGNDESEDDVYTEDDATEIQYAFSSEGGTMWEHIGVSSVINYEICTSESWLKAALVSENGDESVLYFTAEANYTEETGRYAMIDLWVSYYNGEEIVEEVFIYTVYQFDTLYGDDIDIQHEWFIFETDYNCAAFEFEVSDAAWIDLNSIIGGDGTTWYDTDYGITIEINENTNYYTRESVFLMYEWKENGYKETTIIISQSGKEGSDVNGDGVIDDNDDVTMDDTTADGSDSGLAGGTTSDGSILFESSGDSINFAAYSSDAWLGFYTNPDYTIVSTEVISYDDWCTASFEIGKEYDTYFNNAITFYAEENTSTEIRETSVCLKVVLCNFDTGEEWICEYSYYIAQYPW